MNASDAVTMLLTVLSLAGLWFSWNICWKQTSLEEFRQGMFNIRDRMFLYCAENSIPFNHPANVTLRRTQNALIRYAKQLDLCTVAAVALVYRRTEAVVYKKSLESAIGQLPEEHRDFFMRTHLSMHVLMTVTVMQRSIITIAPIMALEAIFLFANARDRIIRKIDNLGLETIEVEAMCDELPAEGIAA